MYPNAGLLLLDDTELIMQGTPTNAQRPRSTLDRLDQAEGIEAISYQLYLLDPTRDVDAAHADMQTDQGGSWIIGYEPDTDFTISPWIAEGAATRVPTGQVVVGSAVPVSAAGAVTVFGVERTVGAHLEPTGSMLDGAVLADMATIDLITADAAAAGHREYEGIIATDYFSAATLRIDDDYEARAVVDWINLYVRKTTAVAADEGLTGFGLAISRTTGIVIAVAAVVWIILLVGLFTAQSMLMRERRREIQVWRAIGASKRIVSRVLMHEALIVHSAAAAIGVLAAGLILTAAGESVLSDAVTPGVLVPIGVGASVVSIAIGVAATRLAIRSRVRTGDTQMLVTG